VKIEKLNGLLAHHPQTINIAVVADVPIFKAERLISVGRDRDGQVVLTIQRRDTGNVNVSFVRIDLGESVFWIEFLFNKPAESHICVDRPLVYTITGIDTDSIVW
jgi:hypothetical protein